jgi:two-component system sensor histidine kinase CpxA
MQTLLKEVTSDAVFEAQEKGVTVQIVSATDCCVEGSPELVRSAVENVVRNAIRYSPGGQTVELRLTCEPDGAARRAEISVRDHGPGVPDSELENLFRPFYRVADARERETGGIGLGLAITYRAAKLHKGSVTAKNAPGGGLLVTMSLPAC